MVAFGLDTKTAMFVLLFCLYCSVNNAGLGMRSFAHRSFTHLLIRSFRSNPMSDCEQSLRLLKTNERSWANRSGRSRQMSDREQFAQVAQSKWANERFAQKMLAKKSKILFFSIKLLIPSFLVSNVSELLRSPTKNEQCEWIAQVAHQNWATMSNSLTWLRSLTKNERMSESLVFLSKSLIRSFLGKKRAIGLENRWANSQPWNNVITFVSLMYIDT